MARDLILFGAGASHGSDRSNTPPLGSSLFAELRCFDPPGWGQIPAELSKAFACDFEAGMARLAEVDPHSMPIRQRAMARYFFNYRPAATNLYVELARRIASRRWKGACATLNYERLLPLSVVSAGLQPVADGLQLVVTMTPVGGRPLEICLPHGCCHIFCESVRGSADAVSFSATAVTTSGPVVAVSDPARYHERISTDAFPPVMSYVEPRRTTTSGTSFIENQRQRWGELARTASKIAVVGVRVRTRDEHIWKPLADTSAELIYCGGPSAAVEFEQWHQSSRPHSTLRVMRGHFAEEFDGLCRELDLL